MYQTLAQPSLGRVGSGNHSACGKTLSNLVPQGGALVSTKDRDHYGVLLKSAENPPNIRKGLAIDSQHAIILAWCRKALGMESPRVGNAHHNASYASAPKEFAPHFRIESLEFEAMGPLTLNSMFSPLNLGNRALASFLTSGEGSFDW